MLTREQILGFTNLHKELVDVKEWGDKVYVKTMSGAEREAFESEFEKSKQAKKNVLPTLLVYTVCDENGKLLFTLDDLNAINQLSINSLLKVHAAALSVNQITKEDVEILEKS